MVNDLDYEGIEFSVAKKPFCRIEQKKIYIFIAFCYEDDLVFPIHISDQKFKNCLDLLMIINENKSHYVYIEIFNKFLCNKTKCKNKNPSL